MRGNNIIGPRHSIRAAAIVVALSMASFGPRLLSAAGDSRATVPASDSGARDVWEGRSARLPNPPSGPRQFDRDPLDDRIRHVWHQLAELEREPDFDPLLRPIAGANDQSSPTGVALPLSFQIMGLISIALSLGGLAVIVRNRPALAGLRGKNDTREARRNLVRCVVLLLAVNLADLAFTVFLLPVPEFVELNPLADLLRDCLPALIAVKLLLACACAASLLTFWRYKLAQLASWGAAATYVGLAMWWVAYFNAARS